VYSNFNRIVRFDRTTGQRETVNLGPEGQTSNEESFLADVSHDGRYVLFFSQADNLVPPDTFMTWDAFVRDLTLNVTQLVSVDDAEQQFAFIGNNIAPRMSGNGRFVSFTAQTRTLTGLSHDWVFIRDRATGTTRLAGADGQGNVANAASFTPAPISDGGEFVSFASEATNLSAGDTDSYPDAYRHELLVVAEAGLLKLEPSSLAFGAQAVGTTSGSRIVTIRNSGTVALQFGWIGLTGTDASQFARVRHCPALLGTGATCTVEVSFNPTSVGNKSARLVVSIKGGTLRRSVALSGTGQ
jgi:hypothetical protein